MMCFFGCRDYEEVGEVTWETSSYLRTESGEPIQLATHTVRCKKCGYESKWEVVPMFRPKRESRG